MGHGGQLAQGAAGHDAVLVVAEQALQRLHVPDRLLGPPAQRGDGGLGGVPGALGLLARLVQRHVALLAGRQLQRVLHEPGQLAEVLVYGLGEDLARAGGGLLAQGRVREQGVQGVEEGEVPARVEDGDDLVVGALVAGLGPGGEALGDRAGDLVGGEFAEGLGEAFGEDLLVAVLAQLGGQPLQVGGDRVGGRAVEDGAEAAEGAAQPAGGDAHAVHGVGDVLPHGGVQLDEGVALGADVGEDVVAGGDGGAVRAGAVLVPGAASGAVAGVCRRLPGVRRVRRPVRSR